MLHGIFASLQKFFNSIIKTARQEARWRDGDPVVHVDTSASQPPWAATLAAEILARGNRPQAKELITVWSDCAGMASEVFGMRQVGTCLQLVDVVSANVNVCFFLEACRTCRQVFEALEELSHRHVQLTVALVGACVPSFAILTWCDLLCLLCLFTVLFNNEANQPINSKSHTHIRFGFLR
jgi:hypothetical protein